MNSDPHLRQLGWARGPGGHLTPLPPQASAWLPGNTCSFSEKDDQSSNQSHCRDAAESLQLKSDVASLGLCGRNSCQERCRGWGGGGRNASRQAYPNLQGKRKTGPPYPQGMRRGASHSSLLPPGVGRVPRYYQSPGAHSAPCTRPSCEDVPKSSI